MAGIVLQLRMEGAGVTDSTGKHEPSAYGAVLSTSKFKYGAQSLFFDGVDDYVEVPVHDDFNFDAGDFTIEFWLYPTNLTGIRFCFYHGPVQSWWIYLYNNYVHCAWSLTGSDSNEIIASVPLSTNTWQHIAFVRNGSVLTLYIDGVSRATGAITGGLYASAGSVMIGKYGSMCFAGYMDDLRITKGQALYSGSPQSPIPLGDAFSGVVRGTVLLNGVPVSRRVAVFNRETGKLLGAVTSGSDGAYSIETPNRDEVYVVCFADTTGAPQDPLFSSVVALPNLTGTPFTDRCGLTVTNGGALFASDYGGSAQFSSNAYLAIGPSDNLGFGIGDFTIECWIYATNLTDPYPIVFSNYLNGAKDIGLMVKSNGSGELLFDGTYADIPSGTFPLAQWFHVAVTRKDGVLNLFVKGENKLSVARATELGHTTNPLFLGNLNNSSGAHRFGGKISGFRVTKGVSRYSTPFDPPALPLPVVAASNAKIFDYLTPEEA